MPKDSSTHRLSLPPPQILASSGTPSTSFYIINLFLNCHPVLTSNLSPPCLPISFSTKCSNFIRLSSRILPNLDKKDLPNYRPISHLSFLSKLTERAVKQRLTHHLSSNHLLNCFQSAYTAHHSAESTLLSVQDHIIKAMAQQKITALCLLVLSAAFDTIDHSILMHCLSSWFGLNGTACSLLAQIINLISWFCYQYQWKYIRSTSTSSRCSTRLF